MRRLMMGLGLLAAASCGDGMSPDTESGESESGASSTGEGGSEGGTGTPADCGPQGHTLTLTVDGESFPIPDYAMLWETASPTETGLGGSYHEAVDGFSIGLENQATITLSGLSLGTLDAAAVVGLDYREYPAANEARPPSLTVSGPVAGVVEVIAAPANVGDSLCGTFEFTAAGAKTVELSGHFHHTLKEQTEPGPG